MTAAPWSTGTWRDERREEELSPEACDDLNQEGGISLGCSLEAYRLTAHTTLCSRSSVSVGGKGMSVIAICLAAVAVTAIACIGLLVFLAYPPPMKDPPPDEPMDSFEVAEVFPTR